MVGWCRMRVRGRTGATVALPKFSIAGMAWQGYLKDPDHNIFGIHQMDPNAK